MASSISITLQLLSGSDVELTLPADCSNSKASKLISKALSIGDDAASDLVLVDTLSGKRILLSSLRSTSSSSSSPEMSSSSSSSSAAASSSSAAAGRPGNDGAEERRDGGQGPLFFADGAVVLALPAPRPPPERVRRRRVGGSGDGEGEAAAAAARGGAEIDSDDDGDGDSPLRYRPPSNRLARVLAEGARSRGLLPEPFLAVLVRVPRSFWLFLVLWPLGAKVASFYSLGPPFILLSIVAAIFCNLGERKPGEASAYSVFNEGFRSLLGEFRAEAIDDGLRRGNL